MSTFRKAFWQPPRLHGDVIEDRTVSFLELFYDLVYVVVIARAAHHLSGHVSWRGFAEFAVVFGLIWIAWLNGTLHYEVHGREDGRTRVFVFIQMLLLALLAVYTGDATGDGGTGFAIVYVGYFVVMTWLWYVVARLDASQYSTVTRRYLTGMVASIVVMGASAMLDGDARLIVWAGFVLAWVIGSALQTASFESPSEMGFMATDSMVERFGLFTIIVLGEVVVGVVDGLSDVERTGAAVATAMLGLMIGFAFWWTYFDFVGRRLPRDTGPGMGIWMLSHFPVTLSIAASGAAMVSLIEHAQDRRAPAATAWLIAGSVALGLVGIIAVMFALKDAARHSEVYRAVATALAVASVLAVAAGWWRPAPWLLALTLVVILSAVWFIAVFERLRIGAAVSKAEA